MRTGCSSNESKHRRRLQEREHASTSTLSGILRHGSQVTVETLGLTEGHPLSGATDVVTGDFLDNHMLVEISEMAAWAAMARTLQICHDMRMNFQLHCCKDFRRWSPDWQAAFHSDNTCRRTQHCVIAGALPCGQEINKKAKERQQCNVRRRRSLHQGRSRRWQHVP